MLRITADIDKNEFAIFGKHDYRPQLSRAAEKVLAPHLAATFTAYDLRHRCATELAATGDLTGAAYLMGHKQVNHAERLAQPECRRGSSRRGRAQLGQLLGAVPKTAAEGRPAGGSDS